MEIYLIFRHLIYIIELQPNIVRLYFFFINFVKFSYRALVFILDFLNGFFFGIQNVGPLLFSRLFTADLNAYLVSNCEE
jgi:hypothetical protein